MVASELGRHVLFFDHLDDPTSGLRGRVKGHLLNSGVFEREGS